MGDNLSPAGTQVVSTLGILGFNEPAAALQPHDYILTLGIADLLQSRRVLLLVSGSEKQGPLDRLLRGPITTAVPASLLNLLPNVVLVGDSDAHTQEKQIDATSN